MPSTIILPLPSALLQIAQRRGILDRRQAGEWGRHLLREPREEVDGLRALLRSADGPEASRLEELLPSTEMRVGAWRLLARLGNGPVGPCWLAIHDDGRFGVVKQLIAGDQAAARAAFHEQAVFAGRHHLVPVIESVIATTTPAIVHRWIPGRDAEGHLHAVGPVRERRALRLLRHLSRTLAALHQGDRVHGDLRPGNCLIDTDGRLWVAHHGLALSIDGEATGGVDLERQDGAWWRAPEVATGARPSPRSDVYAAGCLLFWLLAGEPPFPASTEIARRAHRAAARPDVRQRCGRVSERTAKTIAKAMATDPDDRYPDGVALRDAVYRCRAALLEGQRPDCDPAAVRPTDTDDLSALDRPPEPPGDSRTLRSTGDFHLDDL